MVKNPPANAGGIMRCRFNPWVKKIPWRRAWQYTLVFLPGESHGQRSLVSSTPGCHKELETTETTEHTHTPGPRSLTHGGSPAVCGRNDDKKELQWLDAWHVCSKPGWASVRITQTGSFNSHIRAILQIKKMWGFPWWSSG